MPWPKLGLPTEAILRGRKALHMAASGGHAVMVGTLLKAGADVAARDEGRNTPLHCASFGGFAAVAQMLLAAGADVAVNPTP